MKGIPLNQETFTQYHFVNGCLEGNTVTFKLKFGTY